eukprot:TRINITY_DN556_c0_g1_i1.p1 TRINITY_DN556_c0_g1~~TRINITY_DN556_c0_g1_i1.p1  ORF type:complete len:141 (-),score=12.43 TRINITY_DN556_c0_g1_i1:310-732(-)
MVAIVNVANVSLIPTKVISSPRLNRVAFKSRNARIIYSQASTDDASQKVTEIVEDLKGKWDTVEEKPAAVGLTVAAVIGLLTLNGVVGAIDKIPVISNLMELVGVAVTSWFVYKYLLFKPNREELKGAVNDFTSKVVGKQ